MAKNNKADMSCARVKKYTASDVSKAERHNERKNETYENMNVIVERIPFNVHFKKPTAPTYMEQLKQMETDGQVSLRGLRKDATLFNEIVIDVNTMVIRLAEMYLTFAECALKTGSGKEEALRYINAIRERSGMPAVTSLTEKIVRYERRVELAFEGLRYFDLKHWDLGPELLNGQAIG